MKVGMATDVQPPHVEKVIYTPVITSPVAIYFLRLLGNYDVIYDESYDETYSVIDEVITRKFRASMEPFCDLKISKYVAQLM